LCTSLDWSLEQDIKKWFAPKQLTELRKSNLLANQSARVMIDVVNSSKSSPTPELDESTFAIWPDRYSDNQDTGDWVS